MSCNDFSRVGHQSGHRHLRIFRTHRQVFGRCWYLLVSLFCAHNIFGREHVAPADASRRRFSCPLKTCCRCANSNQTRKWIHSTGKSWLCLSSCVADCYLHQTKNGRRRPRRGRGRGRSFGSSLSRIQSDRTIGSSVAFCIKDPVNR